MTAGPPVGSTAMDAPKSNWCLIFVVVIVMVAGFSGVGSAQQTPSATANTTTATGGQDTLAANGTTTSSKLPRPTRSLRPCGLRSLLEEGAFTATTLCPRPRAWAWPGFLLPSTAWVAGRACSATRLSTSVRGLSRRFNSRCSRALPQHWERELNPFAVVVPGYRMRRRSRRTTGASLLVTPTNRDVCPDSSTSKLGHRRPKSFGFGGCGRSCRAPPLPTRASVPTSVGTSSLVEEGESALHRMVETIARSLTPTPDANDGWENATPIGTDRTANGTLPVGDQDWHVFSVESSGRITVRLVAGNRSNISGFLYDSSGDLLDRSYIAPGEQLSLTGQAVSAGDYYVFVRNEATNTSGTYAFSVSIDKFRTATDDGQPQTPAETSSGSGPGFGLLAGLVAVVGTGFLLLFLLVRNSIYSD
jgi:hypothetical protein